jgi:sarcosine oxidase subunit gamma
LTERPDVALASLALRRGVPLPSLPGLILPGPGDWAAGEGISAIWTNPDQWLVEASGDSAPNLMGKLRSLTPGCSLTDQSHSWFRIDIRSREDGRTIETLMTKLVNLDAEMFVPGRATRTTLHHMSAILVRRSQCDLSILGIRSAAQSLWDVLIETTQRLETAR